MTLRAKLAALGAAIVAVAAAVAGWILGRRSAPASGLDSERERAVQAAQDSRRDAYDAADSARALDAAETRAEAAARREQVRRAHAEATAAGDTEAQIVWLEKWAAKRGRK